MANCWKVEVRDDGKIELTVPGYRSGIWVITREVAGMVGQMLLAASESEEASCDGETEAEE